MPEWLGVGLSITNSSLHDVWPESWKRFNRKKKAQHHIFYANPAVPRVGSLGTETVMRRCLLGTGHVGPGAWVGNSGRKCGLRDRPVVID